MVPRLVDYIFVRGYTCTLGDCYRDERVTYGHPNSMHRKRLAIDLNLFKDGKYLSDSEDHRQFGEYWESLSPKNTWGGKEDGNHYSAFAEDYGMKY